ncbi:hypothetical protein FB45DRAFT_930679 [Roridomyces roridus]|uniref:Bromodomain associated domain-containing protein n=1 Tax=Roridomyces roridus TaxID=1738132 RepID=A0AAD7BFC9_9AGAR|nr:hypothetical protein FB45DRAFT_930679 [Roridomyces roridus]
MEYASQKLIEAATHRTLHAAAFSRASTHASTVLTDLLTRYLSLLATTSAKYAQHAGRTSVTCADALEALEELGVGMGDLTEYIPEAKELSRYAVYSARRVEELHEFRAHLCKTTREGVIPLQYGQYDEEEGDEEDEEEEEEELHEPPPKRQRTLSWDGHIPSFLPPFPEVTEANADSPRAESPAPMPPPVQLASGPAPAPAVQLASTSTSAADYLLQVPYEQSSLGDVSQWHLPGPRPNPPPDAPTSMSPAMAVAQNPEHALLRGFHHILKHPVRTPSAATPARHRVAMALHAQTQLVPRWDVPDTMYAASGPTGPRAWPIPTAARRFPTTHRSLVTPAIAPLVGSQGSRLPELARKELSPAIYSRVTRLGHPTALMRSGKAVTYGVGVPAPWNSVGPVGGGAETDGKDRDAKEPKIPDATVYATWDHELKDFRVGLRRPRVAAPTTSRRGR